MTNHERIILDAAPDTSGATEAKKTDSEIYAAPGFFPVTVARRIGTIPATDFLWRSLLLDLYIVPGFLLGFDSVFVCAAISHASSMPEARLNRMITHAGDANGYNQPVMSTQVYATIIVTGEDAFEFLQAQLAADLRKEADAGPLLSAWCNPKGRVICLFRVTANDGRYALALPSDLAEEAVRRLTQYRFRAKVEFDVRSTAAAELGLSGSIEEWRLGNLRAGIAEICAPQSEAFTPHMLNLDLLGAVSLDKGCYPGQEIVARTHYRGATKRRLHRFVADRPVNVGDKVSDRERDVGEIVNVIGHDVLAVVPVDRADARLTARGATLRPVALPYLER